MNPAFEPTAMLDGPEAAVWDKEEAPRGWARTFQATGATLAVLALGMAIAAFFSGADEPALLPFALACAFVALVCLRWATAMELRWAQQEGLLDAPTGLYNRDGLCRAGANVLQGARREGRPVSLLLLDFSDLPEVRSIYGRETSRKLHAKVVRKMKAIAGAHGFAARTGQSQFTILLPGVSRERAQVLVQRQLGKPSRVEFDAGDSEIVLVPDIFCEMAAADVETLDDLYDEVVQNLAELRTREQRRQQHLQRERERHSRPMSLPPSRH